ncbi:MAG: 3'-5' exonuclease [Fibrobacteres bacterium]|nr:3'-5' exonuclease [Fibrobacterota bacterium]
MSFRPLTDFVALDLETTGLDFATEEILELGGVVFANGVPSRTFSAVLRTNRPVTSFIEALTGISQAQSTEGREPVEALTEFAAFCGDLPVVAHNSHFDLKFLRKAWDAAGIAEPQRAVFDTLLGARISWPHWPSHKLESLVERLELSRRRPPPIAPWTTPVRPAASFWPSRIVWPNTRRRILP